MHSKFNKYLLKFEHNFFVVGNLLKLLIYRFKRNTYKNVFRYGQVNVCSSLKNALQKHGLPRNTTMGLIVKHLNYFKLFYLMEFFDGISLKFSFGRKYFRQLLIQKLVTV